jgi:hypothetical protein
MIKAFPKIFSIGTEYIVDIFKNEVEITEKIDGSQFCFGKVDGILYCRSKGAELFLENPDKMFSKAVKYVSSIQDKLPDNTIFFTEYLQNPRHNILKYDRVPKNNLILFGVSDNIGTFFKKDHEELKQLADMIDIEVVPLLYSGIINNADELKSLLEKDSVLGGVKIEGVVCKNYKRPFLLGGQPIPLMMGKFVSEKFKETHREKWNKDFTARGHYQTFLESFKTEARWEKSIQHLKEKGELENSPRDIGKLLLEIKNDIEAEEKEDIKNFLWKEFKDEIMRTAIKGFPEWYKEKLLNNSFLL